MKIHSLTFQRQITVHKFQQKLHQRQRRSLPAQTQWQHRDGGGGGVILGILNPLANNDN